MYFELNGPEWIKNKGVLVENRQPRFNDGGQGFAIGIDPGHHADASRQAHEVPGQGLDIFVGG